MSLSNDFTQPSDEDTEGFLPLMLNCIKELISENGLVYGFLLADYPAECPKEFLKELREKLRQNHENLKSIYDWTENAIRLGYLGSSNSESTMLLALTNDIEFRAEDIQEKYPAILEYTDIAPIDCFVDFLSNIDWLIKELESRLS